LADDNFPWTTFGLGREAWAQSVESLALFSAEPEPYLAVLLEVRLD
jgi:hypothetical protein